MEQLRFPHTFHTHMLTVSGSEPLRSLFCSRRALRLQDSQKRTSGIVVLSKNGSSAVFLPVISPVNCIQESQRGIE